MKRLNLSLFILLYCFLSSLTSQAQVFCEDYNSPATNGWFQIGNTTPFPAPDCNVPILGSFGTINFTGQLEFNQFRMRQTTTQALNVSPHLTNQNEFRIEFEYTLQPTNTSSPLMLLAVTENPVTTRVYSNPTATGGGVMENNTNSIEVRIGNDLNTMNNFFFAADSKFGFVRNTNQANIPVPAGMQYNTPFYLRLERINAGIAMLSVYWDPARTNLLGADCFSIDPNITNLSFIQHGGRAGAGCSNITTSQLDNLCIFREVVSDPCDLCSVLPLTVNTNHTFNCNTGLGNVTTSVTGGTPAYMYSWSNGATTANLSNVTAGAYTVQVTDNFDCTSIAQVTVGPPILSANFSVTPTCLKECLGSFTISNPTGGVGPYQYSVNSGPFSSVTFYDNLCGGPQSATIMDANGCQTTVFGNIATSSEPWPKQPISDANEYARARGIHISDGQYLTGQFFSRVQFRNTIIAAAPISNSAITLTSATGSDQDAFIVKYDDCGVRWAFGFGSNLNKDEGRVIRSAYATNPDNPSIFLAANINGPMPNGITDATGAITTTTVNGINLNSLTNNVNKGLVLSIDGNTGAINWVYLIGEQYLNNGTKINDIQLDGNELYVIGTASGSNLKIGNDLHPLMGGWDCFLLHIDNNNGAYSSGNSTTWGSSSNDEGRAISIVSSMSDRYVYATGYVSYKQVNVQGNTFPTSPSSNGRDLFTASFSLGFPSLNYFQIHRTLGNDVGMDIVATPNVTGGNLPTFVVTGYFEHTLNLISNSAATVSHSGSGFNDYDIFVTAYTSGFDHVWSKVANGNGIDVAYSITHDPLQSTVFVAGTYSNPTTGFLGFYPSSSPYRETFISGFDFASGTQTSVTVQAGSGTKDIIYDVESSGYELYTCGQFGVGNLNFPGAGIPTLNSNSNNYDAFFARLDNGGNFFRNKAPLRETQEAIQEDKITLYPNPSKGEFNLQFEEEESGIIQIYDINSKLVYEKSIVETMNIDLDLTDQANGVYFVRVSTSKGVQSKKLIIQQ